MSQTASAMTYRNLGRTGLKGKQVSAAALVLSASEETLPHLRAPTNAAVRLPRRRRRQRLAPLRQRLAPRAANRLAPTTLQCRPSALEPGYPLATNSGYLRPRS